MYNLLMTAEEGAWKGSQWEIERSRFGEHTSKELLDQFSSLDDAVVNTLMSLPALFAYEQFRKAPARVGYLTRIRYRQNMIRIDFRIDEAIPPIPAEHLSKNAWEFDIDKWEFSRTHWAIKSVDLLVALAETGHVQGTDHPQQPQDSDPTKYPHTARALTITPSVFQVPNLGMESDLVAVMMPFDSSFANVYVSIQGACSDVGLRCLRADDIWQESSLMQDIFNLLVRSRVVVVDFSDRNPNVMYETGIAHTLGRMVVPLCQHASEVPFDLRHHRYLQYYPNAEGLQKMREALADRLRTLFAADRR